MCKKFQEKAKNEGGCVKDVKKVGVMNDKSNKGEDVRVKLNSRIRQRSQWFTISGFQAHGFDGHILCCYVIYDFILFLLPLSN